jgi:XTP/dITP diphosphohydrolase
LGGHLRSIPELLGTRFAVDETGDTFRANAELKARAAAAETGLLALADDSGLQVDALQGAPGVYSARYAGQAASDEENNQRLVAELLGESNRRARFRCVLALADPMAGELVFSDGTIEGVVAQSPRGAGGFGYDPLFLPDGFGGRSFAELAPAEKDSVSHRARAVRAMLPGLRQLLSRYLTPVR